MIKKKEKILLVLAFGILLIGSVSALEVRQIFTITESNTLIAQSLFLDKSTYVQGETAFIQDFQDINEACDALQAQFKLLDSSRNTIDSRTENFGQGSYMTAFYEISQDTSILLGTYTIESRWFCDGNELGQDGIINGNVDPSVITFRVVDGDPPPQECSVQCNVGYRLVNPTSPDCFCEPAWQDNNGVCELGEPVTNNDCRQSIVCQPNQIKIEEVCVNPDRICIESGGTKDCGNDKPFNFINMGLYALGGILIIVGGFKAFKN